MYLVSCSAFLWHFQLLELYYVLVGGVIIQATELKMAQKCRTQH